jgi:hypothetical protein
MLMQAELFLSHPLSLGLTLGKAHVASITDTQRLLQLGSGCEVGAWRHCTLVTVVLGMP